MGTMQRSIRDMCCVMAPVQTRPSHVGDSPAVGP